ncbi:hypothetical protein C4A43_03346 [Escherichia coli]|nr:hypothetical protein C4A43_03346 [Escherichia coli]
MYHPAVTAVQHNVAVLAVHATGLHHAAHIQHRVHQHIPAVGGQEHLAVPRADKPPVLHQGIHHITGYLYGGQAAIVQLQRDAFGGRQHRLPARCTDSAAVSDLIRCQHNIAARVRGQRPLVDNFCALFLSATEGVTPVHKVVVFNVAGGGHKSCRIDAGILAKQHTVRVDQEHLTIRLQVTHDAGLTAPHHPVQRHGTAVGLVELHGVPLANIKTVPVCNHVLAVLVNVHLVAGRGLNTPCPCHNLSSCRQVCSHDRVRHHYHA